MILTLGEALMLQRVYQAGRDRFDQDHMSPPERRLVQRLAGKVEDEVTELKARDTLTEAQMELRAALHQLWLEAGEPSTRQMSRQITEPEQRSNMTWHYALRCNPVPSLSTLRALVTYLDGDVGRFEELWFRAKGKTSVM